MSQDRNSVAGNYQQVYGYGTPPPQGYGRPPRGGMPVWAKVLIILVVVMLGGCGAIIGVSYYFLRNTGVIANIPKAKVATGTALKWKTLAQWQSGGMLDSSMGMASLIAGNFDKDPAEELLLVLPPVFSPAAINSGTATAGIKSTVQITELDGSQRPVNIATAPYMEGVQAWDFDGDGVLEIVTWNSRAEVYDTSGKFVTMLNGNFSSSKGNCIADVDGDGHQDLVLEDMGNGGQLVAYGRKGKELWKGTMPGISGTWGNVDSDKYAEFVDSSGSGPEGTDLKGKVTKLPGWQGGSSLNSGSFSMLQLQCADVTGDGIDEVVDPTAGFLNPKTQQYVALQRPIKSSAMQAALPSEMQPRAVAGDFDGDGVAELAVTDSAGKTSMTNMTAIGTGIVIYRADGSVKYYEEFGHTVNAIAAVHDGKRERLAVLLNDKLLLSP